ncbi:MAG TPA: hypothetical protein VK787_08840 [Puia sp.]|jgi:hypothetical protein|nr:hypothetical protein [Puia sp.]
MANENTGDPTHNAYDSENYSLFQSEQTEGIVNNKAHSKQEKNNAEDKQSKPVKVNVRISKTKKWIKKNWSKVVALLIQFILAL